jgi:hypothetical protein
MVVHATLVTGGGGSVETESLWFTTATPMGVLAVINPAATPPYTFSLAVDLDLLGVDLDLELSGLSRCDAMALPPYAELVQIVVLPH